jgi:hypothetical protein
VDAAELDAVAGIADFGRTLTRLRERAGLSVRRVAELTGIPLSTLSGYFAGSHLPAADQWPRLRRLLTVCRVTEGGEMTRWYEVWHRLRAGGGPAPVRAVVQAPAVPPDPVAGPAGPPVPAGDRDAGRTSGRPEPVARGHRPAPRAERALLPSIRPPLERRSREPRPRGRDALLTRLTAALDAGHGPRVHVLHGLAGAGKSTVALALAATVSGRGAGVWWAAAGSEAALADSMYALASELGASRSQLENGALVDLVWRLLAARRRPWLLILDGADDTDAVLAHGGRHVVDGTGWVRRPGEAGTVLVTTRDGHAWRRPAPGGRSAEDWFATHEVRPLGIPDAAAVLRDLAPRAGGTADAEVLADRLGGLPLGLRLAGGLLAATARIPADLGDPGLPRTFGACTAALDAGQDPGTLGTSRIDASMDTSWRLSLDLLTRRGLHAAPPLLHLVACLAPGPVPWTLLLRPQVLATSPLFPGLTPLSLCDAVDALTDLGFVARHRADGVDLLEMPAPVRRSFRDGPEVRWRPYLYVELMTRLLTAAAEGRDGRDPADWPLLEALAGQNSAALALLRDLSATTADGTAPCPVPDGLLAPVLLAARHRRATGRLQVAERICVDAHGLAPDLLGPEHPDVLALEHDLGRVRLSRGEPAHAERGLRAVLDSRVRLLGAEHPDTLTTQHYLARALLDRGRHQEAHAWFTRTLRSRERVLGPAHRDTLTSRNNVGHVLLTLGRHEEAAVLLTQVLAERTELLGVNHPATLVTRQHLARLVLETRGQEAAARAYRALLEDCERVLGSGHPRTAVAREALDAARGPGRPAV